MLVSGNYLFVVIYGTGTLNGEGHSNFSGRADVGYIFAMQGI